MLVPDDLPFPVTRAIHEIVQYMTRHPGARDTLEGIRDWWLPPGSSYTPAELCEALAALTGWGWLVKHTLMEQTVVYGVTEAGLRQGSELLKDEIDQGS
ncbi:MAG: hypothetical protein LAP21_15960 [Acidobacteriia bacterium]|nr:hypothetical protein [Terriglobia bacterium]